jgi:hypothetical protein
MGRAGGNGLTGFRGKADGGDYGPLYAGWRGGEGVSKREILFRGKQIVCREWVYGSLVILKLEEEDVYRISDFAGDSILRVIPETVGQYTGLEDKNGIKIFEGDIVCYKTMNLPVRWDDECSGFFIGKDKYWMMNDCNLEVIGNIHDNPGLLERT